MFSTSVVQMFGPAGDLVSAAVGTSRGEHQQQPRDFTRYFDLCQKTEKNYITLFG